MRTVFSWLARTSLLYVLIVIALALAVIIGPMAPDIAQGWRNETAGLSEIAARIEQAQDLAQNRLEDRVDEARTLPVQQLEQRIARREDERKRLQRQIDAIDDEWLSAYRPSRILERKRAEIAIAVIASEIEALRAARSPRAAFAQARDYLAANPEVPTRAAIAATRRRCARNRAALAQFDERYTIDRQLRELVRSERTRLQSAVRESCVKAATLKQRRERGLSAARKASEARDALAGLGVQPLAQDFADDIRGTLVRDILLKALWALLGILLVPLAWRTLAYYVLAPIAQNRRALRFDTGTTADIPLPGPSRVSAEIRLGQNEEALVRQGYLQSSSLAGNKRTRWLLDWSRPVTSLASGLRFLTAIRGAGERVSVSATRDPLAELAILDVPANAAMTVRPSALAAIVQTDAEPLRITSHWRLFSLPAWLTVQLRYLVFHGPVRLVLKGGRGIRIEPAERGRIVGQDQLVGMSTDLAYSVIRTETFWPYFFGRESLLKDRIEAGGGVVLIEEAPLAGKTGLRRGFAGGFDALLKLFGV